MHLVGVYIIYINDARSNKYQMEELFAEDDEFVSSLTFDVCKGAVISDSPAVTLEFLSKDIFPSFTGMKSCNLLSAHRHIPIISSTTVGVLWLL